MTELIVVIATLAMLATVLLPAGIKSLRKAKKTGSLNNLRTYLQADMLYFADRGEFPPMDTWVPSSISTNRLAIVAEYAGVQLPPGPAAAWPKRRQQPGWVNDPIARTSGKAEGLTVGGGLYTGYVYVGRIDESPMVKMGFGSVTDPEHAADRKNLRRGVLWATLLAEFSSTEPRRFECFHYETVFAYPDFVFKQPEVEGLYRGWSDGSVEWLPRKHISFGGAGIQIRHVMGNYYY
ncbi:MAG TPA: type II secretion system protein [Terrimicrobiaceae bacterium]|nr:type II secretion system protein [Terrimicrobiaceae bacterium]